MCTRAAPSAISPVTKSTWIRWSSRPTPRLAQWLANDAHATGINGMLCRDLLIAVRPQASRLRKPQDDVGGFAVGAVARVARGVVGHLPRRVSALPSVLVPVIDPDVVEVFLFAIPGIAASTHQDDHLVLGVVGQSELGSVSRIG